MDLRWFFVSMLIFPVLFGLILIAEFRQVTAMYADRYISKLWCVRGHHLFTPTHVKLLLSDPRLLSHSSVSICSSFSIEHPVVRIFLQTNLLFHLLHLLEVLLATLLIKSRLRGDGRVLNKSYCWCLDLVLLIMHHACEILLFASILTVKILTLLNWCESRLFTLL